MPDVWKCVNGHLYSELNPSNASPEKGNPVCPVCGSTQFQKVPLKIPANSPSHNPNFPGGESENQDETLVPSSPSRATPGSPHSRPRPVLPQTKMPEAPPGSDETLNRGDTPTPFSQSTKPASVPFSHPGVDAEMLEGQTLERPSSRPSPGEKKTGISDPSTESPGGDAREIARSTPPATVEDEETVRSPKPAFSQPVEGADLTEETLQRPGSSVAGSSSAPLAFSGTSPSSSQDPDSTLERPKNLERGTARPPGKQPPTKPGAFDETIQKGKGDHKTQQMPAVAPKPHIGGYEILGTLGRGGMGVVYKARQLALNRLAALKMVLTGAHASERDLARFQIEAEAVAELQHPNIVQIYEVGQHNGMPFCVLEFIDGGSLQQKLVGKPMPSREAAKLAEQLARAVFFAHQRGIVHRDLKPANILLTQDGVAKITDFGLAKRLGEDEGFTGSGDILGTPQYMAPEQAEGRTRDIGTGTDIYALGAILYDLLTGRPPFRGSTVMDTLHQVMYQEPIPPARLQPKVPRDLEVICLKCLEKEPQKRYSSAEALADDLARFLDGIPIKARATPLWEKAWKWTKRYPARACVAGLGIALMLVLMIGGMVVAQREYGLRKEADEKADEAIKNEKEANYQKGLVLLEKTEVVKKSNQSDKHFRQAWDAVEQMLTRVSEEKLLQLPGATKIRRDLLLRAKSFYEEFLKDRDDHPDLLWFTALAQYRVGRIEEMLGDYPRAKDAYEKARVLLQKSPEQDPKVKVTLGKTLAGLGVVHQAMNQLQAAGGSLSNAVEILGQLHEQFPEEEEYQFELAKVYADWGNVLRTEEGNLSQAEESYRKSLKLAAALVDKSSKLAYWELLALTTNNLASMLASSNPKEAEKLFLQAKEMLQEHLLAAYPDLPGFQKELAISHHGLGVLRGDKNEFKAAEALLAKLTKDYPAAIDYRDLLASTYWELVVWHEKKKEFDKAEENRQLAEKQFSILVKQADDVPRYQHDLAHIYYERGIYMTQLDTPMAKSLVEKAFKLQETLVEKYAANKEYALEKARSHLALGMFAAKDNNLAQSRPQYLASINLLTKLTSPPPQLAARWAETSMFAVANMMLLLKNSPETESFKNDWQVVVGLCEKVAKQFPQDPNAGINLALAQKSFADKLTQKAAHSEAKGLYQQAVEQSQAVLKMNPKNEQFQDQFAQCSLGLLNSLVELKDHAAASKQASDLAKQFPKNADQHARLAQALARCVTLVKNDAKLSTAEQKDLAEKYASQAMTALRQAVDYGYSDVQALKTSLAFESLRERKDFQQLVKELEGKKK